MKLEDRDKEMYDLIKLEEEREEHSLILIASENYVDKEILEVQGSVLTNKYAEGYPSKRYYSGCRYYDDIENIAIERAKTLFKAEHANVQPHSGSSANMAVFYSVLNFGDTILGMDIAHGGHLTHGSKVSFSGRLYKALGYTVSKRDELLDYDEIREIALREKPKMIITGASAYPRMIDFMKFREIADQVGAFLMADIAHIAGLVTAGLHQSPVEYADFVTTTTHKTLRGPRGGLILCKKEFAKKIDSAVFPGIQGGPLMHVIAAKAVAFKNAMSQEFVSYQDQIIKNAKHLSMCMEKCGYRIVSGGTDNHLFLVDLTSKGITGNEAQIALERSGIMVNKNLIPFDTKGPNITSGIRIGTPAVTTRKMKEKEMETICDLIDRALKDVNNKSLHLEIKDEVKALCKDFSLYSLNH
ncbi:MAG TPA: serine hydroxymethyltransferase [Syntrophorhabdaceae bacterium]|jgi:glycine hydroxymethyltransferase|nr:serine hydroxymethyltransferase [Syntrophorhabdaceae bacterium]MDI9562238.1 serine hydroxymethyltransferase [Pseudomonadota bacterium]OQC49559.1 MAG: Serine hydroxymethyltransferase [Deltaproteobacteria bacterium ADurb.Bin026]MBV6504703.1 Serine hydroxymethyltransferase [Syntrophorhabdaceae bacterium]HNQ63547.1 serine hydroxymethyltransferase [Syntrophorhabdaceae bacterium]